MKYDRFCSHKRSSNRGFTLVEMMVVVGIMLLTATVSIAGYGDFNSKQKAKQAAQTLKNNMRLAQTRADSAYKPVSGCTQLSGYQITFTTSQYAIGPVCQPAYTPPNPDPYTLTITLPTSVSFPTPTPGPLLFGVLNHGITNVTTSKTITVAGVGVSYTLTVDPNGTIEGP